MDSSFIKNFIEPVESAISASIEHLTPYQFGANLRINTDNESLNFDEIKIAILGVPEHRNAVNNDGTQLAPNMVRKELYQLVSFNMYLPILDLGNVKMGASPQDTYIATKQICEYLLKNSIIPIVIGGSNDNAFGQYLAYQETEQLINYVHIDSKVDLSFLEENLLSNSYLSKVFTYQPNFLTQFSLLGYQSYLVDYNILKVMDQLNFNYVRLGKLQEEIKEAEPYLRDADLVTIDMSAVRCSEAVGNGNASPNGFFGNEICALARYAGMSDRVSSFGVFEGNPNLDVRNQTSQLMAQIIWYFIEGITFRVADYPIISEDDFLKYTVHFTSDDQILVFLKSRKSNRWWLKVPIKKNKTHKLISCSYSDYQTAMHEEYPDKWLQAFEE